MNISVYLPLLVKGALVTFQAWILSGIMSLLVGTAFAVLACVQLSSSAAINYFIKGYTFLAKGVPAYVHILIAYFVIPFFLGINVSSFFSAVGALAFCSSGYVIEIIRSGINNLPVGQWDACFVLGYSYRQTLCRVILPQAFKNILPALLGECEQLLKSTSLLATIGVTELTRAGMNIISRQLNPVPIYLCIAGVYLLFSASIALLARKVA